MTRIVHLRQDWGDGLHGGSLRTSQISEVLRRTFPGAVDTIRLPHWNELPAVERAAIGVRGLTRGSGSVRRRVYRGRVELLFDRAGIGRDDVLAHESPLRLAGPIADACVARGLRSLAFPHNIEALSSPGKSLLAQATELGSEIQSLAAASGVVTISPLDSTLLSLFGISSVVCPYWPAQDRLAELKAIRARRAGTTKTHVLIVGTAGHPPTGDGMRSQLDLLRRIPGLAPLPVVVVGYGTEALAADPIANVTVLGAVSWSRMQQLWAETAVAWVYQRSTTGAVTRLTDLCIAGVPTCCNREAVASVPGALDLTSYEDLAHPRWEAALETPVSDPSEAIFAVQQAAERRIAALIA
jgi:hypothetical protein